MIPRRGYILLTVLLLLMLAAVVMASFCRLAIQRSLQSSAATDEIQRRWGTISCRDTLLPNAENLLELNETAAQPIQQLQADFTLGGEQFTIAICDEQAKANVNALYAVEGKDRAEQSIQALVQAGGGHLKPRLRLMTNSDLHLQPTLPGKMPAAGDDTDAAPVQNMTPVFGSWSDVFADAERLDLFPDQIGAATTNLTCWGDGSLNLRRASLASLTQMCSPTLSPHQIAKLFELRNQMGDNATVDQLLTAAKIETADSINISPRLTLNSATQSLWITSRDHSATTRSLIIRDASNSGDIRSFSFQW